MNLTAYFSNGWLALAPDAFSYGPSITQVLPNAGTKSGGTTILVYGYGIGNDPGKLTITIGGQAATVQKVDALPTSAAALSLGSAYPFPLERITLSTPTGLPGKADISITAPSGSTMLFKSFQFLTSAQTYSNPGLYKFVLYDSSRQRVFLSGLTIVQLASVPLGIGGVSPLSGAVGGGTSLTIRGSGFQSGTTARLGGKQVSITSKDMNTLSLTTPALSSGPQQLVLTNPDGESVSLDVAFLAQ